MSETPLNAPPLSAAEPDDPTEPGQTTEAQALAQPGALEPSTEQGPTSAEPSSTVPGAYEQGLVASEGVNEGSDEQIAEGSAGTT